MAYSKSSVTDNGRGKNLTGFEYAHQHSSTAAEVPTAADLRLGELAVNSTDKKILFKNSSGAVQAIPGGLTQVIGILDNNGQHEVTIVNGLITSWIEP
jgi:hypothetical protein